MLQEMEWDTGMTHSGIWKIFFPDHRYVKKRALGFRQKVG